LIQDIRGRGLMVGVQFVLPSTQAAIAASSACPATGASASSSLAEADKSISAASANATVARPHEVGIQARAQVAPRIVKKCLEKGMLLLATSV
jgi:4-aminobutyrate aminotransferase-like enzyme